MKREIAELAWEAAQRGRTTLKLTDEQAMELIREEDAAGVVRAVKAGEEAPFVKIELGGVSASVSWTQPRWVTIVDDESGARSQEWRGGWWVCMHGLVRKAMRSWGW